MIMYKNSQETPKIFFLLSSAKYFVAIFYCFSRSSFSSFTFSKCFYYESKLSL